VPKPSYFPLPISLEEITPAWLSAAVRQRAPHATVRGVEIVEFIRSTSTKIRLRLDLDEAAKRAGIPELVILKGGFEAHSRNVGMANMHEREVRGYRDVFPVMPLPTPACYFADYDPERQQGIIIMEDLKARGVTFCHATQPQTFEQVARRMQALARFHARSWASPELHPGGKWAYLDEFLTVMRPFFNFTTQPENWDGSPGFFDTLASRGPGMLEVSYHISAAIDLADRPRWEGALVQVYLDELARSGVEPPAFDEAMRQYGVLLLYGYFIWITTESHYQTESVNTANAARVSAAMIDHDIDGLLNAVAN